MWHYNNINRPTAFCSPSEGEDQHPKNQKQEESCANGDNDNILKEGRKVKLALYLEATSV